jgi:hypothetical protein
MPPERRSRLSTDALVQLLTKRRQAWTQRHPTGEDHAPGKHSPPTPDQMLASQA